MQEIASRMRERHELCLIHLRLYSEASSGEVRVLTCVSERGLRL